MGKTVPKGLSIYPDFATNELKENPHQPYEWIIKLYSKNKTNNLQNREKGGKKKEYQLEISELYGIHEYKNSTS